LQTHIADRKTYPWQYPHGGIKKLSKNFIWYGWIPKTGYGAGLNKSVTHLEADLAKSEGLPILPFFKVLKYSKSTRTEDAQRRDAFRDQVGDWTAGHFRAEFKLASDLERKGHGGRINQFTVPTENLGRVGAFRNLIIHGGHPR
jgi:hypothetical protein